jgi:hypothetical protein
MITGKMAMVWKIRNWRNGVIADQVAQAKELGLSNVCIKIVDDTVERWESNPSYPTNQNQDYLPELVPALRAAGIGVSAWGYTYGRFKTAPYTAIGAREGAKAAEVMQKYGIADFLADAETEYERSELNMKSEATAYMKALKAGLPSAAIYLCSYRFPVYHMGFPWAEFLAYANGHAPQVYFLQALNADAGAMQLAESSKELQGLKALPMVGIAPTYEHTSNTGVHWRASKVQLAAFFQKAKDMGMPGFGIWCLDLASSEQIEAVKEFKWVTEPPVGPQPAPDLKTYLASLDNWARGHGYTGPKPPLAV